MAVLSLKEVAIVVNPKKDNIAVVKADYVEKGAQL